MDSKKQFYLDLFERSAWTFVQAFLGAWAAMGFDFNENVWQAALIAGAVSVAKNIAGTQIGAMNSGSWLPARVDPPSGGIESRSNDHGAGEIELLVRVLVLVIVVILVVYVIKALVGAA